MVESMADDVFKCQTFATHKNKYLLRNYKRYCAEHALKLNLSALKRNRRPKPPLTAEVLLNSVSHYITSPKPSTSTSTQQSDDPHAIISDEEEGTVTKSLDPFVDIDSNSILNRGNGVLDMCSESDSDIEPTEYGSTWNNVSDESSDNNSIDSEKDALKHANIYTTDEAVSIMKNKLTDLKSLYTDQFQYLKHRLRENRRRYLLAKRHEEETYGNIDNQVGENAKERRLYRKLKAYNSYRKTHGTEAICHERYKEHRAKVKDGYVPIPEKNIKCIFTEYGYKCGERTIPLTRYCPKHILEDPNQILFKACGKIGGEIECKTPVESIFDNARCRLHTEFPSIPSYCQVKSNLQEAGPSGVCTSFDLQSL